MVARNQVNRVGRVTHRFGQRAEALVDEVFDASVSAVGGEPDADELQRELEHETARLLEAVETDADRADMVSVDSVDAVVMGGARNRVGEKLAGCLRSANQNWSPFPAFPLRPPYNLVIGVKPLPAGPAGPVWLQVTATYRPTEFEK